MAIFNGYVKLPEGSYLSWSSSILPHGHIKNPHFRWEQQQVAARSPYVVSWNPVNITMLAVRAKNLAWIYDISTGVLVDLFSHRNWGTFYTEIQGWIKNNDGNWS